MIFWGLMATSILAGVVSYKGDYRPAVVILLALISMRITATLEYEPRLISSAIVWICAAAYILNTCRAPVVSFFVIASGLCYLWARVTLAPIEFMSIPFVASDVLCLFAIIAAGLGSKDAGKLDRGSDMGAFSRLHASYNHSSVARLETEESR